VRTEAAMNKLSFRARALDSNKSLPVYHAKDIPDLAEFSSVNRVVPQMPTGMEKEEETEHHLQRAITAQQIYGEANRRIIPTPEAMFIESDALKWQREEYPQPKQLIHVQAFTLEDELPDYDLDSDDEAFLVSLNKSRAKAVLPLELEKMIDKLEKGCGSYADRLSLNEATLLIKYDCDDVIEKVYMYWTKKRKNCELPSLTLQVKTEKKDGSTVHDPYVAFRRRIEKMQTRKNRKNDEASYEKMLKLRRDLNRACKILELVKKREQMKKDLLKSVVDVFENRYKREDFTGELLKQCYHILRDRQAYLERQAAERRHLEDRMQGRHVDGNLRTIESNEEFLRKRARAQKRLPGQAGDIQMEADLISSPGLPTEPEDDPPGPDGEFTFKRKRGVLYRAPRYDSSGNWPWVHPVEGGSGDHRYRYCCTSLRKPRKCIGFARRRIGRGGRVIFDRAWTPFDEFSTVNAKKESSKLSPPNGVIPSTSEYRVPPWPHFKPLSEVLEDSDTSPNTPIKKFMNSRFRRESRSSSILQSSPRLYRSFSTQPTSKFRVNPYPTNGVCVNNQTFLSSLTSNLIRGPDNLSNSQKFNASLSFDGPRTSWTNGHPDNNNALQHSQTLVRGQSVSNSLGFISPTKLSSSLNDHRGIGGLPFHAHNSNTNVGINTITNSSLPVIQPHTVSSATNRLPPTGPSSAVFQLNFPLLKSKSPSTPPSKGHLSRRISSSGDITKDHRNGHKRNSSISLKNGIPSASQAHFRQALSAGANQALNVTRAQETLPAFNTFRRPSTELQNAAPAAEVK